MSFSQAVNLACDCLLGGIEQGVHSRLALLPVGLGPLHHNLLGTPWPKRVSKNRIGLCLVNRPRELVGSARAKIQRAYHAKVDAMKKLEEKFGPIDDRVEMIRIELVALKESVKVANARYKAWKDAHPAEVVDPLADKLYKDLLYRSRFFRD